MMALEAAVHVAGSHGERSMPLDEFYLLPGNTPQRENVLAPGELITYVTLPPLADGTRSYYLKLRDRASYEFALASAAVVVQMNGGRIVRRTAVALGGVGNKAVAIARGRKSARRSGGNRRLSSRRGGGPARRAPASRQRLQDGAGASCA